MTIQQISLFVENKPGHISASSRLLAQEGVDIRALYLADTHDYGVLRMIVSDWRKATSVLEAQGFVVKVTDVLAVEVPDHPGGLADVLEALDRADINIEYMYDFHQMRGDKAILIFRFANLDAAIARLQSAGIRIVESAEVLNK
jgi:hypothetical protein